MANNVSDGLGMVTTTTVHGGTWLFPKSIRADTGFSQQVFKATGEYRGSVDDPTNKISVRDGDFVLRVNMGAMELALNGTLHTQDGYSRAYEGTVLIQVMYPAQFAIAYRQGADPAGRARTLIDGDLTRWAVGMKHDEIKQEMLRFRARHALTTMGQTLGLEVVSAEKLIAYADPIIAERIRIEHEDQIAIAKRVIEVRQKQDARDDHVADRAVTRDEKAKDEMAEFQVQMTEQTVKTVVEVHQQQLRELLEQGFTLEQINTERPDLMRTITAFANLAPQQRAALAPGNPAADYSGTSGGDQSGPYYPSGAEHRSDLLGAWLQVVPLADDQQTSVDAQQIGVEQAYQIVRVDQDGPAVRANLRLGDILVQINGQLLRSAAGVDGLLRPHSLGNAQAWVWFIRDTQVYQAVVAIAA